MGCFKPEKSVNFLIHAIARHSLNATDKQLVKYGITNQQGRVLGVISRNLKAGNEITRKCLETEMELKGSSVTSLLDGLEKHGFIARAASKDDRRALSISLLPEGVRLVEAIHETFADAEAQITRNMSQSEIQALNTLLAKAHSNMITESNPIK